MGTRGGLWHLTRLIPAGGPELPIELAGVEETQVGSLALDQLQIVPETLSAGRVAANVRRTDAGRHPALVQVMMLVRLRGRRLRHVSAGRAACNAQGALGTAR